VIGLLACHFLAAAILPWLPAWLRRRVFLLGGLPLAATLAWSFAHGAAILAGRDVVQSLPWAPDLGLDLVVRVDAFSLLMIALVSGIGVLIFTDRFTIIAQWLTPYLPVY
jgi:multicomponent Na+:H+ antiporter subunit A